MKELVERTLQKKSQGHQNPNNSFKVLEKETCWLHQGSTNNKSIVDITFESNALQFSNKDPSNERNMMAVDGGATALKINSNKF